MLQVKEDVQMPNQAPEWVLIIVTPLLWAAGILLMRFVAIPAAAMPFFVGTGSLIPCLVFSSVVIGHFSSLSWRSAAVALAAGALNGTGLILFWGGLVGGSARGLWELSKVGPLTYALLPSFLAMGSWLLFGERFSLYRLGGVAAAAVAIVLLSRE